METKEFLIEAKANTLTAYAATFHKEPDSYGDIIQAGAFRRALDEMEIQGKKLPLLFDHRMDDPFMNIGVVTDAYEDEIGLHIDADFDMENDTAVYVRKLVQEGRLSKMSFAYSVRDSDTVRIDGKSYRRIKDVDIYEVSVVTVPANQHADILDCKMGEDEEKSEPTEEQEKEVISDLVENWLIGDDNEQLQEQEAGAEEAKEAQSEERPELSDQAKALLQEIAQYSEE